VPPAGKATATPPANPSPKANPRSADPKHCRRAGTSPAKVGTASQKHEAAKVNQTRSRKRNAPGVAELAAAYASGIVKNHPFVDGNKRTGLAVTESFLNLNGFDLVLSDEVVQIFESLAAGMISEPELAEWFKRSVVSA